MDWRTLEAEARKVAASVWSSPCTAELVNGVRCDGVIKIRPDYWVLIEVSKSDTLDKLREDITKFGAMRLSLMAKQIYAECYFVTSGDTSSLKSTGEGFNVSVFSISDFASKFLGSSQYINERKIAPFGSAVDPNTGESDRTPYIAITYRDPGNNEYNVNDIAKAVANGRQVVLLGEFGSGKSRCLMEAFKKLIEQESVFTPFAINLRDHWGFRRFNTLIVDHLSRLGLSSFSDVLIRSVKRGQHALLLDGFDEIGSQSWSGATERLAEVRRSSSEAVRDLLANAKGAGLLITGREHYFDTYEEMAESLGLNKDYLLLQCPAEFSDDEAAAYISLATGRSDVPDWMPKKPLICQLLARLDPAEIDHIQSSAKGEVEFFEQVFDAVCVRETKIHSTVQTSTLRDVLLNLAQSTREKPDGKDDLSPEAVNEAFYKAAGYAPLDEAAILLQRLPYLGRVGAGSPDRRFIDQYAKDGLRGLATAAAILAYDADVAAKKWVQPLRAFGIEVLAGKGHTGGQAVQYAKHCSVKGNQQLACDIVATISLLETGDHNYNGLMLTGGDIELLSFSGSTSSNLNVSNIYVRRLVIDDAKFDSVGFGNCIFAMVEGIGSLSALPDVFSENCVAEKFEPTLTVSRISELNLSNAHKTLMALLKKLFFQPGGGRQEDALLRGTEGYWDMKAAEATLRYLETHRMVLKTRGAHGTLYVPQRRFTRRMQDVSDQRSASSDEIWTQLNHL